MRNAEHVRHGLSTRTILKVCVALVSLWLLTRLWPILLVLAGALILVGTLSPLVARVERHVRRGWAVALVLLSLSVVTLGVALVTVPAFLRELIDLIQNAPQMQARLAAGLEHLRLTAPLAASVRGFQLGTLVGNVNAGQTLAFSSHLLTSIGYAVTSVVLGLYLIADRDRARGALYAWVPRSYHVRLARVLLSLESVVGGYMRGQVITSVAIAVFAFALLSVCRVPNALALACFAGMTDIIPFVGGLLATLPAVLAAMSRGVGISAIVLVAFVLYQSFESRVLVPRVYGRSMRLSSASVLLALLIGGELLGIVGALIALPVAAGIRVLIEELRVDRPGDDSDHTELRAHDAKDERVYAARTAGADPEEAAAVAVGIAAESPPADKP